MGSLTHYKITDKRFKQTSGCKDFIREFLYIRYINNKCFEFLKMLYEDEPKYEDIFWSSKAKELTKIFKDFLHVKMKCKFQNISKLNLRLSSFDSILHLRIELYYLIGNKLDPDFIMSDDEFQDFFENFIIFTHRIFLKKEKDYEDDIFDINEYRGIHIEIDSDVDIDIDSDSDSDSDSDNDSESD